MAFREEDQTLISRRSITDLVGVRIARIEDHGAEWHVFGFDGSEGKTDRIAIVHKDGLFDADGDYFADE